MEKSQDTGGLEAQGSDRERTTTPPGVRHRALPRTTRSAQSDIEPEAANRRGHRQPGGVVSGHDYLCTGPKAKNVIIQVKHVIDAYVQTYEIKNFYTFGNTDPSDRRGDSTKSWFWIKGLYD